MTTLLSPKISNPLVHSHPHLAQPSKHTIAVGLSGGVDSSLTARILVDLGYNVIGLTMAIWDKNSQIAAQLKLSSKHACFGPGEQEDIEIAQRLCDDLHIPLHVVNLQEEYSQTVLDYFTREYRNGRTPNPCVTCNEHMKFGFLLQHAQARGIAFDAFATGHYARIVNTPAGKRIARAQDALKDQSYFIWGLQPEQLHSVCFPLGEYTKDQVRQLAREYDLEVAERQESQDFIDGGDYTPLFSAEDCTPGQIIHENGTVLGTHNGIIHFTIGQRKGLGIQHPTPLYVTKINAKQNQIIVNDQKGLFAEGLYAGDFRFYPTQAVTAQHQAHGIPVEACIRLNRKGVSATLFPLPNEYCRILFDVPQRAVTPGQTVVIYQNNVVVGGGIIEDPIFHSEASSL